MKELGDGIGCFLLLIGFVIILLVISFLRLNGMEKLIDKYLSSIQAQAYEPQAQEIGVAKLRADSQDSNTPMIIPVKMNMSSENYKLDVLEVRQR